METRGTIMEVRVIERVVSLTNRHRRVDVNVDLRSMSVMSPAVYASRDKTGAYEITTCPVLDPSSSTFDPAWGAVRVRVRKAIWGGCRSFVHMSIDIDVNVNIGLPVSFGYGRCTTRGTYNCTVSIVECTFTTGDPTR